MADTVGRYPSAARLPRWVGGGAVAGALSVLIFQQGALALLHGVGLTASAPSAQWSLAALWSLLLWGAVWGALLAATLARLDRARLVLAAAAFGAVLPTVVALAVLAPLRGQPTVTGVVPLAVLEALLVNAAWGAGTGLGLAFFGRPRAARLPERG